MLFLLTLGIITLVALAHWREGIFSAATICFNTLLAGVLTFNFWPPLADLLEDELAGSPLQNYEDAIALTVLFVVLLGVLRIAVVYLVPEPMGFSEGWNRFGGLAFGVLTGYLVAGFLICVLQTLPLPVKFMGFEPRDNAIEISGPLPANRGFIRLMYRGATVAFGADDPAVQVFERFEKAFADHRRYTSERDPLPIQPAAVVAPAAPATKSTPVAPKSNWSASEPKAN